jgi:hypothetical protein
MVYPISGLDALEGSSRRYSGEEFRRGTEDDRIWDERLGDTIFVYHLRMICQKSLDLSRAK